MPSRKNKKAANGDPAPRCRFFIADPDGDIELSGRALAEPFRISADQPHPFLTLGDYFEALRQLVFAEQGNAVPELQDCRSASEIIFKSEKHGALYHISTIQAGGKRSALKSPKLAVTTALSENNTLTLKNEYLLLRRLTVEVSPGFLPKVYMLQEITRATDKHETVFTMMVGEWLEDYHEWHISIDDHAAGHAIKLWDYRRGFRFLTPFESFEVIRQAAAILTTYYNPLTSEQVYPWHHAAGDFIVRADGQEPEVMLITIRNYVPFFDLQEGDEANRLTALFSFLLNMTLKMRLDRLDGTGEAAWLEEDAVKAVVTGFFDAMQNRVAADRWSLEKPAGILELLKSFDREDIFGMFQSLLQLYASEDEGDFALLTANIEDHTQQLHAAIGNLRI